MQDAAQWFHGRTGLSLWSNPGWLYNKPSLLETHIRKPLGTVALDQVTSEQVAALIASLRKDGKASKTIVNCLALLGRIFAYGQKKSWCRENPCARVERPKVAPTTDIRFLDQDDLSSLLAAIDTDAKPFGKT
ncbi:MAG TPA: hypothetical protein VHM66_08130, partial [Solirubrobacterales bacterium]|nr:hypothetical protein [Solirubrobacterales bacterium]